MFQANHGSLKKDSSDIWHYVTNPGAEIEAAAAEAIGLRNQRKGTRDIVMFFWYMNTYAPIRNSDSPKMLVAHFQTWQHDFTTGDAITVLRMISRNAGLALPIEVKTA